MTNLFKQIAIATALTAAAIAATPANADVLPFSDKAAEQAFRDNLAKKTDVEALRTGGDRVRHGRRAAYNKFVLETAGKADTAKLAASGDAAKTARTAKAAKAAKGAKAAKIGLTAGTLGAAALVIAVEEGVEATTGANVTAPVVEFGKDLTVGTVQRIKKDGRVLKHLGESTKQFGKTLIVDNAKNIKKTFTKKGQIKKNLKKWGCGWKGMFKKNKKC